MNEQNTKIRFFPSMETSFIPYETIILFDKKEFRTKSYQRSRTNKLYNMTEDFINTYKTCNPQFRAIEIKPQRILTHPSEPLLNNKLDNEDSNLICKVHDILQSSNKKFIILDLLGTGTFGQVFRCQISDTKEIVAVKVIKNKPAYHKQGLIEHKIVKLLNTAYDIKNQHHIVRLLDSFEYCHHICLVFELLSMSLLDLLTQNQFRGLPLTVVQRFTREILIALVVMEEANVIHCDLKPENILLVPPERTDLPCLSPNSQQKQQQPHESDNHNTNNSNSSNNLKSNKELVCNDNSDETKPSINNNNNNSTTNAIKSFPQASSLKVIDFGSACFEGRTAFAYIQSRFYRSPEVLLGVPYNGAIDIWSLGCVCAEMFLGLPLFPGVSQHNQLSRIVEMLGLPPDFLIEGRNGSKYFTRLLSNSNNNVADSSNTTCNYRLKTPEEYAKENNTEIPILKKYLRYNRLDEVIMRCPLPQKARMNLEQKNIETLRRRSFLDFLQGVFQLNPFDRWTAKQAMGHPFILNTVFTSPYKPLPDMKINERKLHFMVLTQKKPPSSSSNTEQPNNNKLVSAAAAATNPNISSNKNILSETSSNNSSMNSTSSINIPSTSSSITTIIPAFHQLQLSNRTMTEPVTASEHTSIEHLTGPMLKRGKPVHLDENETIVTNCSHSNNETSARNDVNSHSSNKITASSKPIPIDNSIKKPQDNQHTSKSNPSVQDNILQKATTESYTTTITEKTHSLNQTGQNNRYNKSQPTLHVSALSHSYQNNMRQHQQQQQLGPQIWNHSMNTPNYHAYSPQQYPPALHFQYIQQQQQQHSNVPPIPVVYNPNVATHITHERFSYEPSMSATATTMHISNRHNNIQQQQQQQQGSPYSTGTVGSVQEDNLGMNAIMTDFGFAISRPELDEQRRLQSSNSNSQLYYWQPVMPPINNNYYIPPNYQQQQQLLLQQQQQQQQQQSMYLQQQQQQPNLVYSYTAYPNIIQQLPQQQQLLFPPNALMNYYSYNPPVYSTSSQMISGSYDSKTMNNLKRFPMKYKKHSKPSNNNNNNNNIPTTTTITTTTTPTTTTTTTTTPTITTEQQQQQKQAVPEIITTTDNNICIGKTDDINNEIIGNKIKLAESNTSQTSIEVPLSEIQYLNNTPNSKSNHSINNNNNNKNNNNNNNNDNHIATNKNNISPMDRNTITSSHRKLRSKTDITNLSVSYLVDDNNNSINNNSNNVSNNNVSNNNISNNSNSNNDLGSIKTNIFTNENTVYQSNDHSNNNNNNNNNNIDAIDNNNNIENNSLDIHDHKNIKIIDSPIIATKKVTANSTNSSIKRDSSTEDITDWDPFFEVDDLDSNKYTP